MFSRHRFRRIATERLDVRAACIALWLALALCAVPEAAQAEARYASIVIDHNTGRVLYARSADARRYPASLTKMMTLYLLFEQLKAKRMSLHTRLRVTERAEAQVPSKLGLKSGQTVKVIDAIGVLVTKSANDVAVAVAENIAGSEPAFARLMTARARQLGMTKTVFRNASGLPDSNQVTTARDMATLSRRLIQDFPEYYSYFSTKYFTYGKHRYRNHNGLLFSYRGTDGIKTGYIRASGFNLAASVKRDDKHLIAVVLGGKTSRQRNNHMMALLNRTLPKASDMTEPPPLPERHPDRPPPPMASIPAPVKTATLTTDVPLTPPAGTLLDPKEPQQMLTTAATPPVSEGDFHVQVGAFGSRKEAVDQLHAVRAKVGDMLEGHPPITMSLSLKRQHLYRARFAGFSREAALHTCDQLKRRSINCIVMRAE